MRTKGVRKMKARTPPDTYGAIKREVAAEMERRRAELFVQAAGDLIPQAMAVFLWTMAINYGWGEKRLRRLADDLHETGHLMNNPSRLHHRFTPLDCEREIKEKYGIDIRAEFPVTVEDERGKRLDDGRQDT